MGIDYSEQYRRPGTDLSGPWTVRETAPHIATWMVFDSAGLMVCEVTDRTVAENIASLPDLLKHQADLLNVMKEIMAVLRKEAPGTSLNNHRFDALGIRAYAAIAKAEGRIAP
jgi:hypothetical protein